MMQLNQRRRLGAEGSFFRSLGLKERRKQLPLRAKLAARNLDIDRSVTNFQDLADDIAGDYKELKLRFGTAVTIACMQGPSYVSLVKL